MLWKRFCVVLVGIGLLSGCGEDDGIDVEIVPPRDLDEVAIENDAEIREYLQSHFYNYEEFENPPADLILKFQ